MDGKPAWCLDNLKRPCVDPNYLAELHGVTWPVAAPFPEDMAGFFADRPKTCEDGKAHRWGFEFFLQSRKLLSRNEAAARLGMQATSLDALVPLLPQLGLRKTYEVYSGIINESLSEDLTATLPGVRFRTFGTHDSFCELLHNELAKQLGLRIKPLFCRTSERLGDERMFASAWDNVLLEPLSVKHSVWLDFGKPLALSPDRCSKLFYAEHQDDLKPFLAGRREPHDLKYYLERLGSPA